MPVSKKKKNHKAMLKKSWKKKTQLNSRLAKKKRNKNDKSGNKIENRTAKLKKDQQI